MQQGNRDRGREPGTGDGETSLKALVIHSGVSWGKNPAPPLTPVFTECDGTVTRLEPYQSLDRVCSTARPLLFLVGSNLL